MSDNPSSSKGQSKKHKHEDERDNASLETADEADNASSKISSYAESYPRVSKDSLYMIIALWMEDFVDEDPEPYRKVGAVLVLPNDVVLAADCSRDGVHAVARLLMKHHDKAKGCKMFMSRKPCPMCAKLLVQSKVERVLFLPFEPEYYRSPEPFKRNTNWKARKKTNKERKKYNNTQMKQVDMLFTASPIAQTKFVLQVEESVLVRAGNRSPTKIENDVQEKKERLIEKYSAFTKNSKWMKCIKEKLAWPAFDTEIYAKFQVYFTNAMEWMSRVLVLSGSGLNYDFERAKQQDYADDDEIAFEQLMPNDPNSLKLQASWPKFIAIARFLAERTDDPKAGVGAVIVSQKIEILALGWNGFPLKALYGEYPRAADSDETTDKKGPYIIHAEQNALLMRNQKNIEGSTLFLAGRPPCNECAPLIAMQGVGTVVVDADKVHDVNAMPKLKENYKLFPEMVKNNKFVCYRTKSTKKVTVTKR